MARFRSPKSPVSIPSMILRSWTAGVVTLLVSSHALAGIGVWTSAGPEDGRVRAFAVDTATPGTVYAGTAGGGVFKSIDRGAHWTSNSMGMPTSANAVTALVVDPSTSSTIYAATHAGVFKSTNAGAGWTSVGLQFVLSLAIDPSTPTTLYAGTSQALFKSTNGGASWNLAMEGLGTDAYVHALVIDPTTPSTVYAANGVVYKSIDGGDHWDLASSGLLQSGLFVLGLAIDPTDSNKLYAGTWQGVFRSTDAGSSWSQASDGLPATSGDPSGKTHVNVVGIDPSNPATLYAGTFAYGVFKSIDAGTTWTAAGAIGINGGFVPVLALGLDASAPTAVYAAPEEGGVFKSTTGGAEWNSANVGLSNSSVSSIVVDPAAPHTLFAGTEGRGVFSSNNGATRWDRAFSGGYYHQSTVTALVADPTKGMLYGAFDEGGIFSRDADLVWRSAGLDDYAVHALTRDVSTGTLYAGTDGDGVFESLNGGALWALASTGITSPYVYALTVDRSGALYAGTPEGVFVRPQAGASWQAASTGLGGVGVNVLESDPSVPGHVYAGTDGGGFFKTTNGGMNWNALNDGLPSLAITAVAIDPFALATIYTSTLDAGVFKTNDGGLTWTPLNDGLVNLGVRALEIDPVVPTRIYAATSGNGVFRLDQTSPDGESAVRTVTAGGSCSTDADGSNGSPDGALPIDPIETSVKTPNAGGCGINEVRAQGSLFPGYSVLGYAVTIEAPDASALNPLQIVFVLDKTLVGARKPFEIHLLKDGVQVQGCSGSGPDPCVSRKLLPDGDVQLTVFTSTASIWSPIVASLDSYLCYSSTPTKGAAPVTSSVGHLLADALDTKRFDLAKLGAVCLPAARDDIAVTDAATALQTTARKAGKVCSDTGFACKKKGDCTAPATCDAQPKFAGRDNVTVLSALGAIVVDVTKPTSMLLPSATSASNPPDVPNPALDAFACYATKPHPKVCTGDPTRACATDAECGDVAPCFAAFPKDLTVHLDEAVATPDGKLFAVKKPTKLCLPAELDGAPRKVPSVALQCYAIAPAKKQPKHAPVGALPITTPPLGDLARDTRKEAEVCIPSEVHP